MEIVGLGNILSKRSDFLRILKEEHEKCKLQLNAEKACLQEYQDALQAVEEIGKKVEHQSLLKLSNRLYAAGKITHAGEFTVDLSSTGDSYKALFTLSQTLQYLRNKILAQTNIMERTEAGRIQLEERLRILEGDANETISDENLPPEIRSDKGVALRVGEFYEILEYEQ